MDFDDLDDEIDRRIAEGEEVEGYIKLNSQPKQGTVLPLMSRSPMMPSDISLPKSVQKALPPSDAPERSNRCPVVRLLCVHGAGDSVPQGWAQIAHMMPPDIEMATHEFPGHGNRESEPLLNSASALADDAFEAFKGSMETGAFGFLGHSIGCLIVVEVAERARRELGVEPVAVFMSERGPPHLPLLNEYGLHLAKDDPVTFMQSWNPQVMSLGVHNEGGKRALDKWANSILVENDTHHIGWHLFKCPIYAFGADWTLSYRDINEKIDVNMLSDIEKADLIIIPQVPLRARREREPDGTTFLGQFRQSEFEQWERWTEHPKGCTFILCEGSSHVDIKTHELQIKTVVEVLRDAIGTHVT